MRGLRAFFVRLGTTCRPVRRDRELADELNGHLEFAVDEYVRLGMGPGEARRRALVDLGGMMRTAERYRERAGLAFARSLFQDAQYGLRMMIRSPGFSGVAVLTLALGIGANTAMFSLLDAVMFKPLPVRNADQLFVVSTPRAGDTRTDLGPSGRATRFSYPGFRRYTAALTPPAALAAMSRVGSFFVRTGAEPQGHYENVQLVSGEFFPVFEPTAERGRLLTPSDERDGAPVAVLSDFLWRRRFNASEDVVGQTITIGAAAVTVVGVLEAGFTGPWTESRVGIWLPLSMQHAIPYQQHYSSSNSDSTASFLPQEGVTWLTLVGRSSGNPESVRGQLEAVHQSRLQDAAARANVTDPRLRERFLSERIAIASFRSGFSGLRDQFSRPLLLLMVMVGVLMLIACANIATLLLARSTARQREFAIRQSLGASGWRLGRQILVENLILAVAAGMVGVTVAYEISDVIAALMLNGSALTSAFSFDGRVVGFLMIATFATALLAGIGPAVRASRSRAPGVVASGGQRVVSGGNAAGMRRLVVLQFGLSLILVLVAAMSAQSLLAVRSLDPGFDHDRLVQVRIEVRPAADTAEAVLRLQERLIAGVLALPGVESAAFSWCDLASNCRSDSDYHVEGYEPALGERVNFLANRVSPGYFDAVGMTLLAGRGFDERDREGTDWRATAVVNKLLAERYFRGRDPIGKRLGYENPDTVIIGVVGDARVLNPRESPQPMVFYPLPNGLGPLNLAVRTSADPRGIAAQLASTIARIEPRIPVGVATTLDEQLERDVSQDRLTAYVTFGFGGIALLLAAIGLYGVIAYGVARRTSEIGVRIAIGARPSEILRLIIADGGRMIGAGLVLGLTGGWLTTRIAAAFLFDANSADITSYALVLSSLLIVGLVACYIPARRAMRLDPMSAVRCE